MVLGRVDNNPNKRGIIYMQERIEAEKKAIIDLERQMIMRQGRISLLQELIKEAEEAEKPED